MVCSRISSSVHKHNFIDAVVLGYTVRHHKCCRNRATNRERERPQPRKRIRHRPSIVDQAAPGLVRGIIPNGLFSLDFMRYSMQRTCSVQHSRKPMTWETGTRHDDRRHFPKCIDDTDAEDAGDKTTSNSRGSVQEPPAASSQQVGLLANTSQLA